MRIRSFAACLLALGAMLLPSPVARADGNSASTRPVAGQRAGVKVLRNLPYVDGGVAAQSLDLYLPEKPAEKPLPLIVWIHGGGWSAGSKNGTPAAWQVARGYAVASVEYRFSQKALFPAQIQDCQAAIRWLRGHAAQYNCDPNHIGAWGASAGGHLVALLGTTGGTKAFAPIGGNLDQSDAVQAVCDFFGPTDFANVIAQKLPTNVVRFNTNGDPYSNLIGGHISDPANHDKVVAVSPIHYVGSNAAPFLIMHGTADPVVPCAQSEELANALRADGVAVYLQEFPGAMHGGPAFGKPRANQLVSAFFDKYLKGADVKIELIPQQDLK